MTVKAEETRCRTRQARSVEPRRTDCAIAEPSGLLDDRDAMYLQSVPVTESLTLPDGRGGGRGMWWIDGENDF